VLQLPTCSIPPRSCVLLAKFIVVSPFPRSWFRSSGHACFNVFPLYICDISAVLASDLTIFISHTPKRPEARYVWHCAWFIGAHKKFPSGDADDLKTRGARVALAEVLAVPVDIKHIPDTDMPNCLTLILNQARTWYSTDRLAPTDQSKVRNKKATEESAEVEDTTINF
jgi:hypothetical protein